MFWNSSQRKKKTLQDVFYFFKRFVAKWLDQRGLMWPAILERGESPGDRRILVSGNYQVRGCPGNHFRFQCDWNVIVIVLVWFSLSLCDCHFVIIIAYAADCSSLWGSLSSFCNNPSTPIITKITKRYSHYRNSSNFINKATHALSIQH